jgi:hypothetical protein
MTAIDQDLDHFDHLRDVPSSPRLIRWWQAAEGRVRLVQLSLEAVGVCEPRRAGFRGLDQDLVIDVGDVGDHRHLVATPGQPPAKHIKDHFLTDVP